MKSIIHFAWLALSLSVPPVLASVRGQSFTVEPSSAPHVAQAQLVGTTPYVNGLGQDYVAYDFGTYNDDLPWHQGLYNDPNNNNWYVPAHQYKNPVYLYQLNPTLVHTQLLNMRSAGVDVLVLHMVMGELAGCEADGSCPTPYNDGIWGEATDVSGAALRPQQQTNLANVLQDAAKLGFRKIFLRFAGGDGGGSTWDETEYQKNWNFIVSTHGIATSALAGSATRLMVDLGIEQGGAAYGPLSQQYVQRLWSDYTYGFGTSDTVGFSTLPHTSTVQDALSWYGATKPAQYAFDVYGSDTSGDVGSELVQAWSALGSEGSKPVMLMETFFNDSQAASQLISNAFQAHPSMVVTDVVSWPVTRTPSCPTCNYSVQNAPLAALKTNTQVSNYLPFARVVAIESTNTSQISIQDVNCATTFGQCTIQGNFGAPAAGTYVVIATDNVSGRRSGYWSCGTSPQQANWIDRTRTYRFDYYKVSSCTPTPSGAPDASAFLSIRVTDRIFANGFD